MVKFNKESLTYCKIILFLFFSDIINFMNYARDLQLISLTLLFYMHSKCLFLSLQIG